MKRIGYKVLRRISSISNAANDDGVTTSMIAVRINVQKIALEYFSQRMASFENTLARS
jgi:hypothetical protein